ncbi:unnamed protein product, partial [Choristocarpus tenellus]
VRGERRRRETSAIRESRRGAPHQGQIVRSDSGGEGRVGEGGSEARSKVGKTREAGARVIGGQGGKSEGLQTVDKRCREREGGEGCGRREERDLMEVCHRICRSLKEVSKVREACAI